VDAALPYELRALEAALSAAARLLEAETSALEARALPSLHSLTQKVAAPAYECCCSAEVTRLCDSSRRVCTYIE
jgi:hypothetical protein